MSHAAGAAVTFAARLVLATAMLVAAVAKARDRPGFTRALVDFGVSRTLAPPLGVGVPGAEVFVAGVLVAVWAPWPGWLAVALLTCFTVLTVANLARGNRAPCPCFGMADRAPLSGVTVVRDAWLLALALVASAPVHRGMGTPWLVGAVAAFSLVTGLVVLRA